MSARKVTREKLATDVRKLTEINELVIDLF